MSDETAPVTTVVPFASLPSCARNCGPLYDANGACVPPGGPEGTEASYQRCFCQYPTLQGLNAQTPSDVCGGMCDEDPQGYARIQGWFINLCNSLATETTTSSEVATTSTRAAPATTGGGSWLDNHWKWVVMLIIITVGIISIWVGACIWRRKYLKKKDRMYELGKHHAAQTSGTAPWAPGSGVQGPYGDGVNPMPGTNGSSVIQAPLPAANGAAPGAFMSHGAAAGTAGPIYEEKHKKLKSNDNKKRWGRKDRS